MPSLRPRFWTATVLCSLLAVVHTWPLATNPGVLSRNDNGDTLLNEWILAWVAHQLPRNPAQLFEGNIFYPARDTLAFSEPLIVPALMGAPLSWLGASPVLVYNLVLMAGFALTALAGYKLTVAWTGDRTAGLLAGSLFAFNTHTLTRLAHVQGIHGWGLPLALLATDRLIVESRRRDAIWLAFWMATMAYTSGYLIVFATVMVGVALVARLREWWPKARQVVPAFALATVLGILVSIPVYLPYRRVARDQGMTRSLEHVAQFSASPEGYLASASRLHYSTWSADFFRNETDSFFPGFIAVGLACVALMWALRRLRARATESPGLEPGSRIPARTAMLVSIGVVGVVLSLGTRTPVYGWLFEVFPPLQGLRAAARFGNLFLLAISVLAGFGLALVRRRVGTRWAAAGIIVVIAANAESLRAPFEYRRFEGIPAVYSLLADEPGRVVLAEVPFYLPQTIFMNGAYVLNSTAHWQPLMNGYSGYTPISYRRYAEIFWHFPNDDAIAAMRSAGVTHVMVHPDRFHDRAKTVMAHIAANPRLERIAISQGVELYRLK